ncbi:MAG: AI-2E family transporter [Candidatus Paceibacterota bacterium]|jgi:predicted PurR-regulated permease PerM
MQTKIIERYFFFGLLLATLIFTFFIFQPFWIVLVLGACFAVILRPIYEWFKKIKFPSWLSSLLTVAFFTIIICGPLLGLGLIIFNQSQDLYNSLINGGSIPSIESIDEYVQKLLPKGINFDLSEKANDLIYLLSDNLGKLLSTTLNTILTFILMLLAIFYFLKDGAEWKKSLITLSPLSDSDDLKILNRLSLAVNAVIKGYLLIAIVQGTLMGMGLAIFGVPNPALWGVIAAIASLIPTIGTGLISIPAIIFLFMTGNVFGAIALGVWSLAVVSTVDNFLTPYIVGSKISIPPFLILFSVLGGIVLLGAIGILIGPLTISLLYTLVSIYRSEFQQNENA